MSVLAEVRGNLGVITLDGPQALNALTLPMVRDIASALSLWRGDSSVAAVLLRGEGVAEEASLPPDAPEQDDLGRMEASQLAQDLHGYGKPVIALVDGIAPALAQAATLRVVTEVSRLALPEASVDALPHPGAVMFLARCPGRLGEYLALTGQALDAGDAVAFGLADVYLPGMLVPTLVEALADQPIENAAQARAMVKARAQTPPNGSLQAHRALIDAHFAHATAVQIVQSLLTAEHPWARELAGDLRGRSIEALEASLARVRQARATPLAEALRRGPI